MKHFVFSIALVALSFILFTACRKESAGTQPSTKSISANDEEMLLPRYIDSLTGIYDASGTRTGYYGSKSNGMISFVVDIPTPKEMTAQGKYTLLCDYADLGGLGAQYVISYDPGSRTWDVLPNETFQTTIIMPGTWKVLAKKFDRLQRKFYFKTFYTNTAGDDRVTEETLVHQ